MVWGSFLITIAAAARKTPTRNGYNAQGVNLNFRDRRTENLVYPRSTVRIPQPPKSRVKGALQLLSKRHM